MAQDLFSEIQYLPHGDFTQDNVIVGDVIAGKKLPTSISIFKSDKTQVVFLELWNEIETSIRVFVRVGNNIYMNNPMSVFSEEVYAHTFHKIDIKEGEEILASAEKENSISYNIIL